jgi:probable F420-dependent oxidoreductase
MEIGLILPMGDDESPGVPVSYASILDLARQGEAAGLDSLWVYDHLLSDEGDGRIAGQWEAWTVLSALAAATARVRLGTLVTCTGFRHPALLAKMAHAVQEISGGRLVLGIGAGWHEPEYRAFGYPFDRRVDRFAEAIEIITTLLRDGRSSFQGEFHALSDCVLLPKLSDPGWRTPVLVGARGPRMLRLTARWADSWNTAWYGHPDERFAQQRDDLHAACAAEGRDPASVEVTVGMVIGGGERPGRVAPEPAAVRDALAAWREQGVGQVICWPFPTDPPTVEALLAGLTPA